MNTSALGLMAMSRIEQLSLLKLMINIMDIDGDAHPDEHALVLQYAHVAALATGDIQPDELDNISFQQAALHVSKLNPARKLDCQDALMKVVMADGVIDIYEVTNYSLITEACGFPVTYDSTECPNLGLHNFIFDSQDHLRHENQVHVSGPHTPPARRLISVVPNIQGGVGYTVSVSLTGAERSPWGDQYAIGPKQMQVIAETPHFTALRGYGADPNAYGDPAGEYNNYGLDIIHPNGNVDFVVMNLYERRVKLIYE